MADSSRESSNVLIQSLMKLRAKTSNKVQITGCESGSLGPPNNGCDGLTEVLKCMNPSFTQQFLRKTGNIIYARDNLRVPVTAVDRCLTEKEYKSSIICDIKFKSSKHTSRFIPAASLKLIIK